MNRIPGPSTEPKDSKLCTKADAPPFSSVVGRGVVTSERFKELSILRCIYSPLYMGGAEVVSFIYILS